MGHSKPTTTLAIYTHLFNTDDHSGAMAALGAMEATSTLPANVVLLNGGRGLKLERNSGYPNSHLKAFAKMFPPPSSMFPPPLSGSSVWYRRPYEYVWVTFPTPTVAHDG